MSRREAWRNALHTELKRWSSMSAEHLVEALSEPQAYEVEIDARKYQVEVELLEDTDKYVHVSVSVDDGTLPWAILPLTHGFLRQKAPAPRRLSSSE